MLIPLAIDGDADYPPVGILIATPFGMDGETRMV